MYKFLHSTLSPKSKIKGQSSCPHVQEHFGYVCLYLILSMTVSFKQHKTTHLIKSGKVKGHIVAMVIIVHAQCTK